MKKVLTILCAVCLLMGACTVVASAEEPAPAEVIYMDGKAPLNDVAHVLIDLDKVDPTNEYNEGFGYEDTGSSSCKLEKGLMRVHFLDTFSGQGKWFQEGLNFCEIDDNNGKPTKKALSGFQSDLGKSYAKDSKTSGIAIYVDASQVVSVPEVHPFFVSLYIQEYGEKDKNGNVIMCGRKKNKVAITNYKFSAAIPVGFEGWIKIPFCNADNSKWGEEINDIADQDNTFNGEHLIKTTFVSSFYPCHFGLTPGGGLKSADFYIGDVVIWDENATPAEKPSQKPVEQPSKQPAESSSEAEASSEEATEPQAESEAPSVEESSVEVNAEPSEELSEAPKKTNTVGIVIGVVAAVVVIAVGAAAAVILTKKKKMK